MAGKLVGRKQKHPEKGVFIDLMAEWTSALHMNLIGIMLSIMSNYTYINQQLTDLFVQFRPSEI
jgi:hypothetical protein